MMRAAIASMLGALGCFIAFAAIGSSVAADGRLVEPFYLIPIAWLLLLTGAMLAIATLIVRGVK